MELIRIALVGQPNVGKSMLINAICGSNLKVGNFAGATVEKSYGHTTYKEYNIELVDLPGIYSLDGYTEEEKLTKRFLQEHSDEYDFILNIADSTNLERNLMLTAQLIEVPNKKVILALNMSDEAERENIKIDTVQLEKLLGISLISVSATTKQNIDKLLELIVQTFKSKNEEKNKRIYGEIIEEQISSLVNFMKASESPHIKELESSFSLRGIALSLLKMDEKVYAFLHDKPIWAELSGCVSDSVKKLQKHYETQSVSNIFSADIQSFVSGICSETIKSSTERITLTQRIDNILINKFLGMPIFLFFMWVIFWLTFTVGSIPMDYIEISFGAMGDFVKEHIENENIASIVADGAIAGVGAVVMFLPNIIILFFGIALLETTGYMARVAFLLDGIFHKFGLHGKSFIPLVTGFGCSVPAFMAARILKNKRDRFLTLFIINFMSCGARLPIYVLFIGTFFPEEQAANWLFGIYIFGALVGLIAAKVLRLTAFKGDDEPFVMEMPKYRLPSFTLVWMMIWNKALMYLKKAGTFILAASLLIWFASNYPHNEDIMHPIEEKIVSLEEKINALNEQEEAQKEELQSQLDEENVMLQEQQLNMSYIASAGKLVEPFFAPLGFDWKLSVSILSGLAAKEVAISTMGVLYALGDSVDEENDTLRKVLKEKIPFSVAVSFILFTMFYNPCLAATAVFGKETGGLIYVIYLFLFTTFVAYLAAFIGTLVMRFIA